MVRCRNGCCSGLVFVEAIAVGKNSPQTVAIAAALGARKRKRQAQEAGAIG